jgi:hypothetical protein
MLFKPVYTIDLEYLEQLFIKNNKDTSWCSWCWFIQEILEHHDDIEFLKKCIELSQYLYLHPYLHLCKKPKCYSNFRKIVKKTI